MNNHSYSVIVNNLTVVFDQFIAVNNISFKVNKGEIFGFLGANGAGKTTTIRVLCGLLYPTSGQVKIANVQFENDTEAIKLKVGHMSQKFTLYNDLTVEENFQFVAGLRKISRQVLKIRSQELLGFIDFKKPLNTLVRDLPGGIKQQVSLAASLLHDPEIIFLDEPTAGVTPVARAKFWNLIRQLSASGKTVFVTTHYMDEAEGCDRIALMRGGEIIALDTPLKLKKSTFNSPMYEFEPTKSMSIENIYQLKMHPLIQTIESYGMKFHVTLSQDLELFFLQNEFKNQFYIRSIEPTLEDVFIKLVEGNNR